MTVLIRNAVLPPSLQAPGDGFDAPVDLLLDGDRIAAVTPHGTASAAGTDTVVDASGLVTASRDVRQVWIAGERIR